MAAAFSAAGETVSPQEGTIEVNESPDDSEEETGNQKDKVPKLRKPHQPTREEWEEHMILHLPYRNWCPHCVNGRAKNEPHRRIEDRGEESIPVIAIDYMYMISERDDL